MRTAAFERSTIAPPTLDEKNRRIIEAVYHHRLLTTDHCQALVGLKSRDKINLRLKKLYDARYLDRPEIQKSIFAYAQKRPMIHALGDEGARYVRDVLDYPVPPSVQWGRKNRELKDAKFIAHRIGSAEVMTRLQVTLDELPGYRLIQPVELVACAPEATLRLKQPFSLPSEFTWTDGKKVRRTVVPDHTFGIENDAAKRALFFLEWDEGTETLTKMTPYRSSILQKLYSYSAIWRSKLHQQRFDFKNFRVLFVTRAGESRVTSMMRLYQARAAECAPAGAFLFTTLEELQAADNPLTERIWLNGRDERQPIVSS